MVCFFVPRLNPDPPSPFKSVAILVPCTAHSSAGIQALKTILADEEQDVVKNFWREIIQIKDHHYTWELSGHGAAFF